MQRRSLWLTVAVVALACTELALGKGEGLVEVERKPSNQTYTLSQLSDLAVHVITNTKAVEGGRCPAGAEEVTGYGCEQGHARIWTSRLCSGAEDASGAKCQKECGAWALAVGNRTLVPVVKQHRCFVPDGTVGNTSDPTAKCPAGRFNKQGGKCRCWVCLVRVQG